MAGMSAISWLGLGLGGALTSIIGYANLPVSWLLPLQGRVPLKHLESAQLQPLLDSRALTLTSDLWSKNGAVVMAVRRPG